MELEQVGSKLFDKIYESLFGSYRSENFSGSQADIHVAIDKRIFVKIDDEIGHLTIAIQEKTRRHNQDYQNITIELDNNRDDDNEGDFRKMCVDYYAYGIFNDSYTSFKQWIVIDYTALKMAFKNTGIKYSIRQNRAYGRASFVCIDFDDLPLEAIFASYGV